MCGPSRPSEPAALGNGATWYKDAIFYEVRTRSFFDSNDDGIGDFKGLTSKLDYLCDLGVNALWILPFYPSPGRDDGYDISDYTDVHPEMGTLTDFEVLLAEAHRRGIRVITELVLNHTSDQHPWFQRARRAPAGSPERDFYVWSETPDRYAAARVIFRDFEPSNWSWDREAQAYYWHRFYSHQPDLNFENPAVREALLGVVDFWLAKGVDGLRLDAVPYLYEQEGTDCENLPKTHAFLKHLRAHIDSRFENRMLLAEANQWPEDAASYFGAGDECHMNFHFPLMPRLFMAIHQEDRLPIVDIFAQTPEVHATCQWALFLRNHDELTLEMVTDEERDYMVGAYAHQAAMRINLGIRRRLAPLVGNSRRRMELLNGLLFSLPGTPVLYYGDEIGMGDNVYLGDRNGVRTPMQWNMDRNAGFSRANPQQLILPIVIDPEYHYESLNVENQQQNPTSLLWWTKRIIDLRKRFAAFGRGTIEFLSPANSRVLAFVRVFERECVLVVANLSRFTQYVALDLGRYRGFTPFELFGETSFPAIGDAAYVVTLGPHDFYWFSLERPGEVRDSRPVVPLAAVEGSSVEALLREHRLEPMLRTYLERCAGADLRDPRLKSVRLADIFRLDAGGGSVFVLLARVETTGGQRRLYALPVVFVAGEKPPALRSVLAAVVLKGEAGTPVRGLLVDALDEPSATRTLLAFILDRAHSVGQTGELWAKASERSAAAASDLRVESETGAEGSWRLGQGRSSAKIRYGDRFVLTVFRRLDDGVSPEFEMGQYLEKDGGDNIPRQHAVLELQRGRMEPVTLGLLQAFVPHVDNGWDLTQRELGRYFERVLARSPTAPPPPPPPAGSPFRLVQLEPPVPVSEMIGLYRETAAQLGRRIAALHQALGAPTAEPGFKTAPYSAFDRRATYQWLRTVTMRTLRLLRERMPTLSPAARAAADTVVGQETAMLARFEPLLQTPMSALCIRLHGDLHLGHVLYTGKDFIVTDIGGRRDVSLTERRRRRLSLRDVASMARSLEFAAIQVLLDPARVRDSDVDAAQPWAFHWASWVSASFLRAYLDRMEGSPLVPPDRSHAAVVFDCFLLERALDQIRVQIDLAPDSTAVVVALLGLAHTLSEPH
jgi:maltose alpha-D-glucosyltransferase / alpha-amylase